MTFLRSHRPAILAFAFILIWTPRAGLAQYNTAEITGTIADTQGAVLPGVTVTAVHAASGLRTERVSDAEGRFFMPALPLGEYTLSVSLPGFKQFSQKGLILQVGQKLNLPII
jgi:hypothetical protein